MVKQRKGDRTRVRILGVADELFATKGFNGVTMIEICQKVGLSRGGLYRYYSSTGALLDAVMAHRVEHGREIFERLCAQGLPPTDILREYLLDQFKMAVQRQATLDRAIYEYVRCGKGSSEYIAQYHEKQINIIRTMIEMGQASGEFVAGDAYMLAVGILWSIQGAATNAAIFRPDDKQIAGHVEMNIRQLSAR